MSGAYERDAKVLIGDEAWTKITNAASSGRISAQQMKDVAWALPTDRDKDKIGAEHEIRMNEKGTKPNETEMKNILKDWFYHGDMPEERVEDDFDREPYWVNPAFEKFNRTYHETMPYEQGWRRGYQEDQVQ